MIRLLAIDIDGTLLDSRGRLPEAHREALAEASNRGITLALATGRSFHFTQHVVEALGLPVTVIVNNGAVVKNASGVTLMRHVLARAAAREILAATQHYEDSVAVVFDRSDNRQIVFERMDWTHPNRKGYYERNKAYICSATPLHEALTEDPIQVMFNGGVARMRVLADELRAMTCSHRFSVALTEYELRDFSLLDVNAAGCSKGSTLERWATANGFSRDEVMAVGDNLNDVQMLQFAGTAIVMGNAADAVRSFGFRVTGSNDEGGLATAVREMLAAVERTAR
jgi:Cof subfamily protein (haloacid dehalogenase superfamily)